MADGRRWTDIKDEDLTVNFVQELLATADSDPWVAAACADRVVDDELVQEELIKVGLSRTVGAVERARDASDGIQSPEPDAQEEEPDARRELIAHFSANSTDLLLCQLRSLLLARSDRLRTYAVMVSRGNWKASSDGPGAATDDALGDDDPWNDEEDAWDEGNQTLNTEISGDHQPQTSDAPPPLNLSTFLREDLVQSATMLAFNRQISALTVLMHRHATELFPYRFAILESIPDYEPPDSYQDLLPSFDFASNREAVPKPEPWRPELDFVESIDVKEAIQGASTVKPEHPTSWLPRHDEPLSAEELSAWYQQRVEQIDSDSGIVDVALALVQHGASQGIPGLDLVGEDLSLLSRLIYDTTGAGDSPVRQDWSLSRWRKTDVDSIVKAYLAGSTPLTIANDLRRLVMPYLFVLESRAERAGQPDPGLPKRHLYHYILDAPLDIAAAIFDNSKPTLNANQRVIRNDEDVARLALAYLYGSDRLTGWPTMSRIFECLPAWPNVTAEDEMDEADTTLASLAAFVTPSTTRPKVTPHDLLFFFAPLPSSALTRALDVLDVHLESGEILARWNVPAPLRWFLQSANDEAQQRARATNMARMAAGGVEHQGEAFETEDEWVSLMEDMVKLGDGGSGPLRAAFGLLSKEEILKIFFGGLLSSGKFALARKMLMPVTGPRPLTSQVIEELCLASSKEFYDNAESGNLHQGEMKLAYDCLGVPLMTPAVRKEREFIEATSRLCSYNLVSRSGIPLSPIEIRLAKDKLGLIAQLLSCSEDVYKHPEVVLELVDKLGFRGDAAAHVKALAMIANTALQSEDFATAASTCDTMVKRTHVLRMAHPAEAKSPNSSIYEATTLCWQTCSQLGGQSEYTDARKKLDLLSEALKMCPSENILDVLAIWRKVEIDVDNLPEDTAISKHPRPRTSTLSSALSDSTHSFVSHLPDLHLRTANLVNPEAAAMAARTFNRVAANFSFPGRGRSHSVAPDDQDRARSSSPNPDIAHQARSVFTRGVGWLIGAEEQGNE